MSSGYVSTQTILTSNFIRYSRLAELISFAFKSSKATEVNIYIDLYGMIKTLFSDSYRTDISDYTACTSTIINMCGHYRSFFKSLGVSTKIFLVFSYNVCEINKKFVAEYNSKFSKKMDNKMIRDMVELNNVLLETLCPFLPDIHFLKTEFESSVLIDYLIRTKNDNNPNIIISKDIYPIQLTYLHDSTIYIKPKKLNGDDISVLVPTRDNINFVDNFWAVYCMARGQIQLNRKLIHIHPINFSLLSAITRFPERDMKTLFNINSGNKIIFDIIGTEAIKLSAESLFELSSRKDIPLQVDGRYKSLDVSYFRTIYDESVESKMIHFINLNDPASVNMICAEYFKENPVDLSRL